MVLRADPFDDGSNYVAPDDDPFAVEIGRQCGKCGNGWCPEHGTFHFAKSVEMEELVRRENVRRGSTGGGVRVIRKKLKGD